LPLYCLLAACATVAAVAVRLLHHCVQLVLLLYRCCTARIACTAVIAHNGCVAAGAGYRKMNPFCIPFAITNMSGALLAMDLGFMGPNYAINTACATGNYCITNAADHIARGDADLMLAGSADASVIPSGIGGFIACKALSKRNDQPQTASRPWDRERDGFVMGEGAGGNPNLVGRHSARSNHASADAGLKLMQLTTLVLASTALCLMCNNTGQPISDLWLAWRFSAELPW